ncbi:hypothetical protein EUTSA_v10000311mg [Eutrema salsugineum]|uniref:Glutathione peroxidase n=3 Tax=Eutrema TaxID=98005 RepID=V4LVQ0_EUTSA|nr:phospholipid hydroperoxide glutathione peroxidase 1, chloroplastic [Eutrema salsugineum]ESQ46557.1 hypothetical protein EUTSA_v10000311mg [Eutrema salsugineum]BAJ33870.1 unnamed protein product [Eutrema halophilum]
MASSSSYAPFSAIFNGSRPNPSVKPAAFLASSLKFSTVISNFANLSNGFSLKSPINLGYLFKSRYFNVQARAAAEKTVHDFTVKDIDGNDVSLNKFKGKVMLIVNVASRCGLTSSNYSELSHLYEKYKSQGFEILAFPCNQFGGQEPGSNPEIKQFACTRFKAEFPIFDKVDVNGPSTAPIYEFLKSNAGGFLGGLIKWNFEKFLIDKKGKVVERYPPTTSPFQIEKDIKKLLAA